MRKKFEVIQGGKPSEVEENEAAGVDHCYVSDVRIIRETEKAFGIWPVAWPSDRTSLIWLPKRLVTVHTHSKTMNLHTIYMPRWLAKEKDLDFV